MDVSSVNLDIPVSDPTVFQKRYLKKIRELGEVGPSWWSSVWVWAKGSAEGDPMEWGGTSWGGEGRT